MVILRSSSGGAVGAESGASTPKRRILDLDSSAEFLSLLPASQRKSARVTRSSRALDDSFSSPDHSSANGHADMKPDEGNGLQHSLRTRGQRVKLEVSFTEMDQKTSSPVNEEKTGGSCTRKSSRLQREGKASSGKQQADVPDEVEGSSTPKRSRFNLQSHDEEEEEEEEEDQSVRRSSRITRYKRRSRNQSVLYDRLITNTAEAVLQKMDDMQKMRRRLRSRDTGEELGMYTRGRMRRSLRTDVESKDTEKENQGEDGDDHHDDDDEEEEDREDEEEEEEEDEDEDREDEDEEEENQRRYDFRQRKTVVRYQAPQDEPREPRKRSMYFKDHSSPTRRRFRFSSTAPRSPYNRRRPSRRRHAFHSSDSTSSSSDEEQFQRRRSKNRSRSVNRCLPFNFVKEDLLGIHKDRMKIGASLADVDPMQIDKTVRFESIGGLSRHISALKEMVVFPLLYPEVFERFKIQPPRGCLFYGPPGTGKTLVARALANECSQGERKVSFFMRKGADCLSKWVGESERQLRLLFDQAYQMRPSIIFFDEIDGLAPVRSSRQDQIHSSIVSTLLALMDGLDARGEVVVIGATNRLDSIDPALRRPGRFDREFLFGLPDREARRDILKIHTRQWTPAPSESFLEELADKCVGYCGADIKAVCSEAALCALRRRYPQIYASSQKLVLDVNSITITNKDFMCAMSKMVPAAQRAVVSPAKALIPAIRPLLSAALQHILHNVSRVFPHAEQGLKRKREQDATCGVSEDELVFSEDEDSEVLSGGQTNLSQLRTPAAKGLLSLGRSVLSHPTSYRPRLLLEGRPGSGQSSHLAPAALHALEKFTVYTLDMAVLFGASATAPEETCAQIFVEAKRTSPSVLYIPHIGQWWETVGPALKATFLSLLSSIPAFAPILLLATCSLRYDQLSVELQELFRLEYGEVFHVQVPTNRERRNFFEDLILNQAARAPASRKKAVLRALEVLPVAAPPPQRQLTEEETQRLEEQEEGTLRELRLFLRDVTNRLSQDKRFKAFTKPVDLEEVPDYAEVIEKPMDLSTVLSNVDRHKYGTVKEFLQEVDLIWQNALEYNPDRDPSDRQIRHRACALKDTVHAIIRDELDEDFEKICEEIKVSRSTRDCSSVRFAPSFYHVLPKQSRLPAEVKITEMPLQREPARPTAAITPTSSASAGAAFKNTVQKKKRRRSRWSAGVYAKKKSSSSPHTSRDDAHMGSDDEEEDGDDEEEVERGEAAECNEGTGEEDDQMVVDEESGPAAVQEGSSSKEDSEEGTEGKSEAVEDEVSVCETEKPESEEKTKEEKETGDEASPDHPGQSGENSEVLKEGRMECSETITENTNKDRNTEKEEDTIVQSNKEERKEINSQEPTQTGTDKCQTAIEADDGSNYIEATEEAEQHIPPQPLMTAEEAEQCIPAEPMELEAAETSVGNVASAASRGEEDTGAERSMRRITRALKNTVQQQQMINVDKALQILDQETPALVVDKVKLKELLERVVSKTDGYEVYKLEKLYALLCQSIYRHRRDYNKTALTQELEQEIEDFCRNGVTVF
ncbi:ATPase family AAA domain-containing protein 2-like isoform X2 [Notolabrus celidotus]|uniref:ATPase family AAA domain-containing protein 2-like isoform X2 n=1 Tax=Notolabrus celidotus TaxID=1203425 RepID=UPI00148FDDDF|nr:ATPase family AAA domain-containing protein 2-like isoform X2 [Notolabrus celidotus]